ncbi:MAG TPA: O-antigen ligase family protein [Candidatus Paceibacterota bacterium]|nr:O-antigen ligase family protein [Candidatus Paceibacterota bacterium]
MKRIQGIYLLTRLYEWVTIVFFISIAFSFRVIASISLIMMLVFALLHYRISDGRWWNRNFVNFFNAGCFLYFIVQGLALLYTYNTKEGFFIQQIDLGLIAIPIAVFYSRLVRRENYDMLMKWYTLILLAASVIALVHAWQLYIHTGNTNYFFYHTLVYIYSGHAIQYSILVFIGILFLIEENKRHENIKSRKWVLFLLVYFSVFLILLTSKMVIAVFLLYIIYLIICTNELFSKRSHRIGALTIVLAALTIIFTTNSPLRKRVSEEMQSNISFIEKDEFSPADYFNGIEFRLLSWRFAYEILNENHAWLIGVSPGDAQDMLNAKYRKMNMFTGGLPDNRKGYLNFHTHNQFLQALLETGIPGLAAFILICAGMIQLAKKSGSRSMIVLTILLLCYCFADAVLKTQYGVILFIFFPLFIFKGSEGGQTAS